MWRIPFRATVVTFALLMILVIAVQAHQSIQAGPYTIEYGWMSEPPIVGQSNAIVINISEGSQPSQVELSTMKVQAAYGGDSKFITLQPLGEDTPGQYIAPILPAQPGTYTLNLSGTLGNTPIQASVQPEEVQPVDYIQFPRTGNAGDASGSADWLGIAGIVLGVIGTGLGGFALLRRKG